MSDLLQPGNTDAESVEPRPSREPLWWMLAMLAAAAIARIAMQWNITLPACNFRRLTGVPCPLCGGTRAMKSAAELDFWTALQFNPLVIAGAVFVLGAFTVWFIDRWRVNPLLPRLRAQVQRWPVWWIIGGLVLVNWAYLIRTLN